MPRYEIRVFTSGEGTTSGTLRMPEAEVRELYEQDRATLDEGMTIELIDLDRDVIVSTFTA